jgi:copper chaperone CopZ
MRTFKTTLAILALTALCALTLIAAETPPAAPADTKAAVQETAIYSVPDLAKGTLVKDLSKAVATKPGIVSAQADPEKSQFMVTFEPGKTNPQEILKAVSAVAPNAKFEKVGPADPKAAAKKDCGKCPSKSTCGAKKK